MLHRRDFGACEDSEKALGEAATAADGNKGAREMSLVCADYGCDNTTLLIHR